MRVLDSWGTGAAVAVPHPSTAPRIGSAHQQHARLTGNVGQHCGRDHRLTAGAADERPKLVDSLGMVRKPGCDGLLRRTRWPGDAAKQIEPELLEIAHQPIGRAS